MDVLAPSLLWLGVVALYGAWWWRHAARRPEPSRVHARLRLGGLGLVLAGFVVSGVGAVHPGAALASAMMYVMAAGTLLALVSPLVRKPVWAMGLLAPVGLVLGVLEHLS